MMSSYSEAMKLADRPTIPSVPPPPHRYGYSPTSFGFGPESLNYSPSFSGTSPSYSPGSAPASPHHSSSSPTSTFQYPQYSQSGDGQQLQRVYSPVDPELGESDSEESLQQAGHLPTGFAYTRGGHEGLQEAIRKQKENGSFGDLPPSTGQFAEEQQKRSLINDDADLSPDHEKALGAKSSDSGQTPHTGHLPSETLATVPFEPLSHVANGKSRSGSDITGSEEEVQAQSYADEALKVSLRNVLPTAAMKEQWDIWREAISGRPKIQSPSAKNAELSKVLTQYGHNNDESSASEPNSLPMGPMKRDLNGNPFGGNIRAKYWATTGLDLVQIAAQWDRDMYDQSQGWAQCVARTRAVASDLLQKFEKDAYRDQPRNFEADHAHLQQLDPPSQIMYLVWPGPYRLAKVALEEYSLYLEDSGVMDTQRLDFLPSGMQIKELQCDDHFWISFAARMGLDPALIEKPIDQLPEGVAVNDNVQSYIGPILYPVWKANFETIQFWEKWHGPDIKNDMRKRYHIESVCTANPRRTLPPDVLREQYSYLQGLDPAAVQEYFSTWCMAGYEFFAHCREKIYARWGMPKGIEIFAEMQQSAEASQPNVSSAPSPPPSGSMSPPKQRSEQPLTPAESLAASPTPCTIEIGHVSSTHSRTHTPMPMEPPIDVRDIGPQDTNRGPELSGTPSTNIRDSSPSYTRFPKPPPIPISPPPRSKPHSQSLSKQGGRKPSAKKASRSVSRVGTSKTPRKIKDRAVSTKFVGAASEATSMDGLNLAVEEHTPRGERSLPGESILQSDGSPPRRSQRIRGKK